MGYEKFKSSLKGKNKNELFNIRMELRREIMKHDIRRNVSDKGKATMLLRDNKKKIAIINTITQEMLRDGQFYYKEEDE